MPDSYRGNDYLARPGENCAVFTSNGESGFLLSLLDSDLMSALLSVTFSSF